MGKRLAIVLLLLSACGGEDVPSCQQAVTHYYEAGCTLVNLQTNQPFSAADVITDCKQLLATSPSSACDGALEDLRVCFGNVKSPASTDADCDCTAEQDAILTCD